MGFLNQFIAGQNLAFFCDVPALAGYGWLIYNQQGYTQTAVIVPILSMIPREHSTLIDACDIPTNSSTVLISSSMW
jgi:hypothetical protein